MLLQVHIKIKRFLQEQLNGQKWFTI